MDNLQACIRSCGKEGCGFREEVAEFVCLSPNMAIVYDFPRFYKYLCESKSRALTERVVLGTAMTVHRGELSAEFSGVSTKSLGQPGTAAWDEWLTGHLRRIRESAHASGGRTAALVLDRDGVELLCLETGQSGIAHAMKQASEAPIQHVVVVLGGPSGMTPEVQARIEELLLAELDHTVRIRLPGGLQHSNVVLADMFMANERKSLMPAVEQLIRCGPQRYMAWRQATQMLLGEICNAALSPEMGLGHIKSFAAQLASMRGAWTPSTQHVAAANGSVPAAGTQRQRSMRQTENWPTPVAPQGAWSSEPPRSQLAIPHSSVPEADAQLLAELKQLSHSLRAVEKLCPTSPHPEARAGNEADSDEKAMELTGAMAASQTNIDEDDNDEDAWWDENAWEEGGEEEDPCLFEKDEPVDSQIPAPAPEPAQYVPATNEEKLFLKAAKALREYLKLEERVLAGDTLNIAQIQKLERKPAALNALRLAEKTLPLHSDYREKNKDVLKALQDSLPN